MSTATLTPRIAEAAVSGLGFRAISYERVSRFTVTKAEIAGYEVIRGVASQAKTADTTAEVMSLGPVTHFTDKGQSASRFRRKEREDWPLFLAEVESGRYTHVLLWLLDRSLRDADDVGVLLTACRKGGAVIVQTATNSVIDPNVPEHVLTARITGATAEYEVAKMSLRALNSRKAQAEAGLPMGGGKRRFGYKPGMMELEESEAAIVREMAERFLLGETLYGIAKWVNEEKRVPAPGGKPWTRQNIGLYLEQPHLAALRYHQGQFVRKGIWPAILSEATHEAIKAKRREPERRTSFSTARKYLLGGLAICQECGLTVRGFPRTDKATGERRTDYVCASGGHCKKPLAEMEDAISALMVGTLSARDASGALVDEAAVTRVADIKREMEAAEQRGRALRKDWAAGRITDEADYQERQAAIAELVAELGTDLATATMDARRPEAVLDGFVGEDAAEAWAEADLFKRRAIIDHLCWVFVKSRHSNPHLGAFDEETDLLIIWKDEELRERRPSDK